MSLNIYTLPQNALTRIILSFKVIDKTNSKIGLVSVGGGVLFCGFLFPQIFSLSLH